MDFSNMMTAFVSHIKENVNMMKSNGLKSKNQCTGRFQVEDEDVIPIPSTKEFIAEFVIDSVYLDGNGYYIRLSDMIIDLVYMHETELSSGNVFLNVTYSIKFKDF